MYLTSPALADMQPVPLPHTCDGLNVSPPLQWGDLPAGTRSLALLVEDVDAPASPGVHWLVFNIPIVTTGCAEGLLPDGATEGSANGGSRGYEGPCPKYFGGTHRYLFRLLALDTVLDLPPTADRKAMLDAAIGHVLDEAHLVGTTRGAQAGT